MARQQGLNFGGSNGQKVLKPGNGRGNLGGQSRVSPHPSARAAWMSRGDTTRHQTAARRSSAERTANLPSRGFSTDAYLRVFAGKFGLRFETYDRWLRSGAPYSTHAHDQSCRDQCRVTRKLHMHSDRVGTSGHIRASTQTCINRSP